MKKAFLQLHLSVLLAGWTGIFGKLITMSPGFIVLWRIIIAGTLLWGWLALRRTIEYVRPKDRLGIMAVGALLMIQWTLFYAAIKASNVSITIVTFSSMGFFTAILEPLITRTRMSIKEIGFSILTVFGISLIFHFDTQYRTGIMLSLTSAAAAAALAVFFRMYKAKYRATTVMSWQLLGGLACALVLMPWYLSITPPESFLPTPINFLYLLIFASFCTIGMYILQIQSLEKISAFTVNLTYNLEPIYSIILAMILFGEAKDLGLSFYIGLAFIALSVGLQTWSVMRIQKRVAALDKLAAEDSTRSRIRSSLNPSAAARSANRCMCWGPARLGLCSLSCHGMGRSFSQFTGIGLGFSKACVPSAGIVTAAFP